jgi:putative DNA primase/helicase
MGGLEGYELVAIYRYEDELGSLLYERGCFHAPGPPRRRRFRERQHDGVDWDDAQEFLVDDVRRVPYRLPQLLAGVLARAVVYVCEGEKDVERMRELGLVATTTFAQRGVWSDTYAPIFTGATVVVLPDNDKQGRGYADLLTLALGPVARSVFVLDLPGLEPGEDVSDWLDRGGSAAALAALIDGRLGGEQPG